jgi:hypothetical protein
MPEKRSAQLFSDGLGTHFSSPLKKRDKKKSNTFVRAPLQDMKRKHILAKLALLQAPPTPPTPPVSSHCQSPQTTPYDEFNDDTLDVDIPPPGDEEIVDLNGFRKRIVPDDAGIKLYRRWTEVLPQLLDPFLAYITSSIGLPIVTASNLCSDCMQSCTRVPTNILCLYFDRMLFLLFRVLCLTFPRLQDHERLQLQMSNPPSSPCAAWTFPNSPLKTSNGHIHRPARFLSGLVRKVL